MENMIRSLLGHEGIKLCGTVSLSDCIITRAYLLERAGIVSGTVYCFAIPYYTRGNGASNISRYAWGRDYHYYVKQLAERLLPLLRESYPDNRFAIFTDHSPIDERHAAAISGIGILGRNGLVITEDYSSYVFIAELITDAPTDAVPHEIRHCGGCGACEQACPYHFRGCLSEVTQRKGELEACERDMLCKYGTAWGCDICAEVCPHTRAALKRGSIYTPVNYFHENQISTLTPCEFAAMSDEEFALRAYSWRGREVIMRNLKILGGQQ